MGLHVKIKTCPLIYQYQLCDSLKTIVSNANWFLKDLTIHNLARQSYQLETFCPGGIYPNFIRDYRFQEVN